MKTSRFVLKPFAAAVLLCATAAQAQSPALRPAGAGLQGLVQNLTGSVDRTLSSAVGSSGRLGATGNRLDLRLTLKGERGDTQRLGGGELEGLEDLLTPDGERGLPALPGLEPGDRPLRDALREAGEQRRENRLALLEGLRELGQEAREARRERLALMEDARQNREDILAGLAAADSEAREARERRQARLQEAAEARLARLEDAGERRQERLQQLASDRDTHDDDDNGFLGVDDSSTLGTDDNRDDDGGLFGAGDSSTLGTDRDRDPSDNGLLGINDSSTLGTD